MRTLVDIAKQLGPEMSGLLDAFTQAVVTLLDEIPNVQGTSSSFNIYGEEQKQLDLLANDLLLNALENSGCVSTIATEELDKPKKIAERGFSVVIDPLDGSSNIESNNLMGTIMGIYQDALNFPVKPSDQICALYTVYGPSTTLVFATRSTAYELVLVRKGEYKGKFVEKKANLIIPEKPSVYGVGGSKKSWLPAVSKFVEELEQKGLKLRYGGSLVGDFNQVLHNGGVFAYPATLDRPEGKLRHLYEAGPIAFIAHAAKGYASDGKSSILEKPITRHDQCTPLYVGTTAVVKRLEELMRF
jgi:fructose-1,6-bisphosphatase I